MSKQEIRYNNFVNRVSSEISRKLIAIGLQMEADIKKSMRGYGQYSRIDIRQTVRGNLRQKGKRKKYHYPSPPGAPPAVDTGRLRASISTNWTGSNFARAVINSPVGNTMSIDGVGRPQGGENRFVVVVGTNVNYAPYLELGTSKMAPRPYLRPVLEKYREKIRRLLQRE